ERRRPADHQRRRQPRPAQGENTALVAYGSLAIILISKSNPDSQVTPTAVKVGYGASPQHSGTTCQISSNVDCGSIMKTVTSTTSSKLHPAAVKMAFRFSKASRTCSFNPGCGEPSSRLPTWPETNRKPLDWIAGE